MSSRLPEGAPTITEVAQELGVSPRTIQRGLGARGWSYSRLLDELRFERAKELLEGTTMKIAEISRLLGYSHASHFVRAFRRWTDASPRQYRSRRLAAGRQAPPEDEPEA